jgi:hypothetical protein
MRVTQFIQQLIYPDLWQSSCFETIWVGEQALCQAKFGAIRLCFRAGRWQFSSYLEVNDDIVDGRTTEKGDRLLCSWYFSSARDF